MADGARLAYVDLQSLGRATWQLAHQASVIGADATPAQLRRRPGRRLRPAADGLLPGRRVGTSKLRAAYIGRDDQMHDFRTLQDHVAPATTSDLLFKGAVADRPTRSTAA